MYTIKNKVANNTPKSDPVERAYEVQVLGDEGTCECGGTIHGMGCYPYGTWSECDTCQEQYD